ncbi:MAG TPA: hypothetical protein PLZ69_00745 [Candidatus Pacearchaeota archaeon]|nr:hypothetical protein [Candidatus Pacearchaeota archaeon]
MTRPTGKEALTAFEPTLRKSKNKKDVVIDFDSILAPLLNRYQKRLKLIKTDNGSVIKTIKMLKEVHIVKYTKLAI